VSLSLHQGNKKTSSGSCAITSLETIFFQGFCVGSVGSVCAGSSIIIIIIIIIISSDDSEPPPPLSPFISFSLRLPVGHVILVFFRISDDGQSP
jgi:hypothetical protein